MKVKYLFIDSDFNFYLHRLRYQLPGEGGDGLLYVIANRGIGFNLVKFSNRELLLYKLVVGQDEQD